MLERPRLLHRYREVRTRTDRLCAPLAIEDWGIQSMPDASPAKWHAAHTTWFFETFVLVPHLAGYRPHDELYAVLFNSYYEGVGPQWPRARRGVLSRPTVAEVRAYRRSVDAAVEELLARADDAEYARIAPLVELGTHHEEQHEELLLTDLEHALAESPHAPAYAGVRAPRPERRVAPERDAFIDFDGGVVEIGASGEGFAFDNEAPAHRTYLAPYRFAHDLVTNGWYAEFIDDHGYERPELWLSDGWNAVRANGWTAPLYWRRDGDARFTTFTLHGREPLDLSAPVCHVSHFEADAFARWAGHRLPTEAEWEHAARLASADAVRGTLLDDGDLHPVGRDADGPGPRHLVGETWVWTGSAYLPYPGYRPAAGAIGEYNGKFMSGQMVLRGASALTPASHVRASYRNFFQPDKRWQLTGVRLATDGG